MIDLTGVKSEMMEMEPSRPVMESYVDEEEDDEEEEGSESDGLIEEDMVSESAMWTQDCEGIFLIFFFF